METIENPMETTGKLYEDDEKIIDFLDSMENYLILVDSLSSALRQGWFELASARHSMGASRVNSALFDLKSHHASMTLQVNEHGGSSDVESYFTLCKWTSSSDEPEAELEDELPCNKSCSTEPPQHHDKNQETVAESVGSAVKFNNQAEKERIKSLSMFGKLVSPKLRATQSSFEKALEMLVEISNVRASLLRAHDQVKKNLMSTE